MKTIYALLVMLLFTTMHLSAQTWDWAKVQPNGIGQSVGNNVPHSIATDAQGFIYVLGNYSDSLYLNNTFITQGTGSYIAKYDSTGTFYWYKLITYQNGGALFSGSNPEIQATEMVVNSTGIYFTGYLPSTNYSPYNYVIGSSVFTVDTTGYYLFGPTREFFVCKMDLNGNVAWNKTSLLCSVTSTNTIGITSDKNNNVIVSGTKLQVGPSNNILNTFSLGDASISDNSGQDYLYKTFYIKISSAGNVQWSNFANDATTNCGTSGTNSMVCDSNNNIYIHANVNSGCQFGSIVFSSPNNQCILTVLAKLTPTGTWSFVKELSTYNEVQREGGHGNVKLLTVDAANNVYALVNLSPVGNIAPYLVGIPVTGDLSNPTMHVVKFNSSGNVLWTKKFGDAVPSPLFTNGDNHAEAISYSNGMLHFTGAIRNIAFTQPNYFPPYFSFGALTIYNPLLTLQSSLLCYFTAESDTALNFKWATMFNSVTNASGFAVTRFNNNIYTVGYLRGSLQTLGHLNDTLGYGDGSYLHFLGKLKDQYIRVGAISAKQVMPGCSITIPFTSTGLTFSAKNKFNAELSNASGDFTAPTVIGTVKSTGTGSINATVPSTLVVGTSGYKLRIRSTDTLLTGFNYFAYADTGYTLSVACPATATGLSSTNITGTTATVNWAAVGCASGYKVQYRVKGTSAWTTQNANSSATSSAITGLVVNTMYQWRISTKCSNNGVNSYSANSPLQQFTTAVAVAVNSATEAAASSTSAGLFIQPNPAKGSAVLVINGPVKNGVVTITDFVGKTVWKKDGVNAGQLVLPVQHFAAGIYIVKLVNGSETKIVKLVKE